MNLNELPDMTDALKQVYEGKKKEDSKPERWQDDDGDGKWYEKSDVDGKISKREKKEKKKDQKEEVEVTENKDCCKKCGSYEHTTKECKATNEEVEAYQQSLQEISPDLALKASKEADKKRGKLAAAGDKEGAAKKNAQAGRLYKAQAKKRLNREETEIIDDLIESGLFSDEEIQAILELDEKTDA
tara:strand:+ start:1687 stop:2244 length:558 start_codon:yes stop_codon:yes gene_type:complete